MTVLCSLSVLGAKESHNCKTFRSEDYKFPSSTYCGLNRFPVQMFLLILATRWIYPGYPLLTVRNRGGSTPSIHFFFGLSFLLVTSASQYRISSNFHFFCMTISVSSLPPSAAHVFETFIFIFYFFLFKALIFIVG